MWSSDAMDASLSPVVDKANAPIPEAQLKMVVVVRALLRQNSVCAHHGDAIRVRNAEANRGAGGPCRTRRDDDKPEPENPVWAISTSPV